MRVERATISGNTVIHDEVEIYGMVTGEITVAAGGDLKLHGTARNVIIEEDGQAVIHGTVSQDVKNMGGILEIYGTIQGTLYTTAGKTFIDSKANIKVVWSEQ